MEYKDFLIKRAKELFEDNDMKHYYGKSLEDLSRFTEEEIGKLYCFDEEMSASFDHFLFECFRSKIICDTYKDTFEVIKPYLVDEKEIQMVREADSIRKLLAHIGEYFLSLNIDKAVSYNYYNGYMSIYKEAKCIKNVVSKMKAKNLGIYSDLYKITKSNIDKTNNKNLEIITEDYMQNLALISKNNEFAFFFSVLNEYYMLKLGIDNNYADLDSLIKLVAIIKQSPAGDGLGEYLDNRLGELFGAFNFVTLLMERIIEDSQYIR